MGKLEEKMAATKEKVRDLADLVTKNYDDAVWALREDDISKIENIHDTWTDIFHLVFEIEDDALKGLVLHQPFGEKFRELITSYKIATELERVGKYTIHVAEAAKALNGVERPDPFETIMDMANKTGDILEHSLTAYFQKDLGSIPSLSEIDDEIDSLYEEAFETFASEYEAKKNDVRYYGHIVLLIRSLERLADHACNIGSRVLFMSEGKRYRIF